MVNIIMNTEIITLRVKKRNLEVELLKLLREFEATTTLVIDDITIESSLLVTGGKKVSNVSIRVSV